MTKTKINWATIGAVVAILATIIGGVHWIDDKIADTNVRVTKLEGAVKALGDNQSDPLKQIIHDLIAAATEALPLNREVSAKAIGAAKSLIETERTKRQPADPAYFQQTLSAVNEVYQHLGQAKFATPEAEKTGQGPTDRDFFDRCFAGGI